MVGFFATSKNAATLIEDEMKIRLVGEVHLDVIFRHSCGGDAVGTVEADTRGHERSNGRLDAARQVALPDLLHHLEQRTISNDVDLPLALSGQIDFGDVENAAFRAYRLDFVDAPKAGVCADRLAHGIRTLGKRNLSGDQKRGNTAREEGEKEMMGSDFHRIGEGWDWSIRSRITPELADNLRLKMMAR